MSEANLAGRLTHAVAGQVDRRVRFHLGAEETFVDVQCSPTINTDGATPKQSALEPALPAVHDADCAQLFKKGKTFSPQARWDK
jgi:hypothetical protein